MEEEDDDEKEFVDNNDERLDIRHNESAKLQNQTGLSKDLASI